MTILTLNRLRPSSCLHNHGQVQVQQKEFMMETAVSMQCTCDMQIRSFVVDEKWSECVLSVFICRLFSCFAYLVKLLRCLLEICRSSSVEVMSIVRFLARGIIYADGKQQFIRHTYTVRHTPHHARTNSHTRTHDLDHPPQAI